MVTAVNPHIWQSETRECCFYINSLNYLEPQRWVSFRIYASHLLIDKQLNKNGSTGSWWLFRSICFEDGMSNCSSSNVYICLCFFSSNLKTSSTTKCIVSYSSVTIEIVVDSFDTSHAKQQTENKDNTAHTHITLSWSSKSHLLCLLLWQRVSRWWASGIDPWWGWHGNRASSLDSECSTFFLDVVFVCEIILCA